jgi:hypothetical protein
MHRHYLLDKVKTEITTVYVKTLFFPVRFQVPDHVKDTIPAIYTRDYECQLFMRFYTPPLLGTTLIHEGCRWQVIDIEHTIQPKGSRKGDECPIVVAELLGKVAE